MIEDGARFYLLCLVITMIVAAKCQNTIATLLLFISSICSLPVAYATRGQGVWQTFFHDFNISNFKIPGIGIIFFMLGLFFLIFYEGQKK